MYSHEMSITFRIESLTPAERWAKALDEDEMITVFAAASKVVKRVLIKDLVHNPTPYANRGWCIGEMEWSSDRQATAQNQLIRPDTAGQRGWLELLGQVPTAPEHFAEKMEKAKFTHRSDASAVVHLQEKIFLEKVRRNAELSLEALPRTQILALAHALPYFEVLQTITLVHFECSQEEAEAFAKVGFWSSLTIFPSFWATWFKASSSLLSINPTWSNLCWHVAMYNPYCLHIMHISIQKAVGKSFELGSTLTPKSKGPKSDPSRPCERRRCWSFIAGPTGRYKKSFNHMIQAGKGTFPGRSFGSIYICHVFCHVGASSSSSSSSSSASSSSSIYCTLYILSVLKCCITMAWGRFRSLDGQALAAVLNETCIAELNFSRKDGFLDAVLDVATVEAWCCKSWTVLTCSCLSGALQSAGPGQSFGEQQPRDPLEFGKMRDWSRRHQGGEPGVGSGFRRRSAGSLHKTRQVRRILQILQTFLIHSTYSSAIARSMLDSGWHLQSKSYIENMQIWRSVRECMKFLPWMIWDGYGSKVEEGIWGLIGIAFHYW